MDSQSLTQLSQTSAETQMRVLEIALQIIVLTAVVLFATTLVIIIWLCLFELGRPRPGSPWVREVQDENTGIPVWIDPHSATLGSPLVQKRIRLGTPFGLNECLPVRDDNPIKPGMR
jgi:hypothetical protein